MSKQGSKDGDSTVARSCALQQAEPHKVIGKVKAAKLTMEGEVE